MQKIKKIQDLTVLNSPEETDYFVGYDIDQTDPDKATVLIPVSKGRNIIVDSITALEALTGTVDGQVVKVKGYYAGVPLDMPDYHVNVSSTATPNGGSVIARPEGGNFEWADMFGSFISCKWYGVTSTGNQTTNLQRIIDNEQKIIIDVSCTFSALTLDSFKEVIISDVISATDSPALSISNAQDTAVIFDVYGRINGDGVTVTQECILINNSNNIKIEKALIVDFLNKGIAIGGTSSHNSIIKPKVRGATGATGAGVSLFGEFVRYNKIDHADCSQNRIGVTLNGCYYNEVNFPIANACTSSGVSIDGIISGTGDGGKYNKINHPICNDGTDVTKGGIFCGNGADYNEIIHPICNGNAGAGVRFSGGSANKNIHNSIIDPVCVGNGTNGMTFSWCPDMRVVNPTIKNNTGRGLAEVDCERFTIDGGIVDNNTSDGVLHQSPNTFDNNVVVTNNGADGLEIAFGGSLGIGDNRTVNCYLDGNTGLDYKPAGTSKAYNCTGFVTDNKGVDNKSDTQTIGHGLSAVPNFINATGSVAGEIVTVTAKDATTFTVAIKKDDGTAGTLQDIYWEASLY